MTAEVGTPRAVRGVIVAVCLTVALTHVLLVFLHVAPANTVTQRFNQQVNGWVFPVFEQNWKLFAPDPDSANRRISARTASTAPDGTVQVSDWFDLTALDESAVEHHVFPSHTAQNLLRRAWTAYVESHGADDRTRSERALMTRAYLRNIAVKRVTAHRGGTFRSLQLRVVTVPVAAPGTRQAVRQVRPAARQAGSSAPSAPSAPSADTRYLPWWKVPSDDH
ncbi:DUF5819 family protein [Streptomyces liangshanensis]|uniref:Uncharacterized protein n=1 Tax=Streptomyces liangshanensis TaxID=2717324 RepID=A0A6G9H022_9ACTN|nr:DUF5819 family protein [Streptomyces liangshanensis]QIQ03666.1 hypothetical protein HA039_16225 [Streptomyces liangshanensis]